MLGNLDGVKHYHMVRVRESLISNLDTPTGVHTDSLVGYPCDLNGLRIRGLENGVHMALVHEMLNASFRRRTWTSRLDYKTRHEVRVMEMRNSRHIVVLKVLILFGLVIPKLTLRTKGDSINWNMPPQR